MNNVICTSPKNLYTFSWQVLQKFVSFCFENYNDILFTFPNLSNKSSSWLIETLGPFCKLHRFLYIRLCLSNTVLHANPVPELILTADNSWVILMIVQMCYMLHFQHVNHWWLIMRYSYPLTAWPQRPQWLPITTAPRNLHRRFHVQSYCRKTETPMAVNQI